jgi:hypothetical protein
MWCNLQTFTYDRQLELQGGTSPDSASSSFAHCVSRALQALPNDV